MKSVYIIAEAGVNHNGDIELAKKLIEEGAKSGADAVKFQTFKASTLSSKTAKKAEYQKQTTDSEETQYEMLKKLELDYSVHEELMAYANENGITHPNWHLMTGDESKIYQLANEGFYLYTAKDESVEGGFEHSGNFALIDKNGFIRSRTDAQGSPIIYYNGMISEEDKVDEEGMEEQISMLKVDIAKLLKE